MVDHKRNPMNGYYALRWQILERDNFTCQYCGQKAPNVTLEVDHILPIEDGGTDESNNLKTSCFACNRGKSGLSVIVRKSKRSIKTYIAPVSPVFSRQDSILGLLISKGSATLQELAEFSNISKNNAQVTLYRLRDKEKVMKRDHRWFAK